MEIVVGQLTADLWPALEDLFSAEGAVGRCWCMCWRLGSQYRKSGPGANKEAFRRVVGDGPPPGLLAIDGSLAVGWHQLAPGDSLPLLDRTWRLKRVDEVPVWSISCFYVRKGYRRRGVTTALITAAVEIAERAGAPAPEAYPLNAELTASTSDTGYASAFERAGFKAVAQHAPARPIMRRELHPAGCS